MKKSEQLKASIAQMRQDIAAAHTQIGKFTVEANQLGGNAAARREATISGLQSAIRQWQANIARMSESLRNIEISEQASEQIEADEARKQAEAEAAAVQERETATREAALAAFQQAGGTYLQFIEQWPQIRLTIATQAASEAASNALAEHYEVDPSVQAAQRMIAQRYGMSDNLANKMLAGVPHRIGIVDANKGMN